MPTFERLKEKRVALGLSQATTSARLSISQPHYSRLETGKVSPSLRVAVDIEGLFGISAAAWTASLKPGRGQAEGKKEGSSAP